MTNKDLICIGVIGSPHGVQGYIKIKNYSEDPKGIISYGDVYNENWNVDNQPGAFFYFKGVLNKVLKKNTSEEWEEKNTRLDIFSEGLSYFIDDQPLLEFGFLKKQILKTCLLYTSPSPRDLSTSRMPSSA